MVYCISYDMKNPNRNFEELHESIKSFGPWWHQTGSVWLVASSKTSVELRDYLKQYIDKGDLLFVIAVKPQWAAVGFTQEEYNWIKGLPDNYWE